MCFVEIAIASAVAGAAVSAAGAVAEYQGQRQEYQYQANVAQYQYQVQQQNYANQLNYANQYASYSGQVFQSVSDATEANLAQQYALANLQQMEKEASASVEIEAVKTNASQARASARVAAAESGASGISVDNLLADFTRQEFGYITGVNRELDWSRRQLSVTKSALRADAMNRISSAIPAPVQYPTAPSAPYLPPAPSFLGAALRIGNSGARGALDIYNIYGRK